jgi:hypothetical protein
LDPRASLDVVAKRKVPSPSQELNPDHPACSLVAILTELSWLLIRKCWLVQSIIYLKETTANTDQKWLKQLNCSKTTDLAVKNIFINGILQ